MRHRRPGDGVFETPRWKPGAPRGIETRETIGDALTAGGGLALLVALGSGFWWLGSDDGSMSGAIAVIAFVTALVLSGIGSALSNSASRDRQRYGVPGYHSKSRHQSVFVRLDQAGSRSARTWLFRADPNDVTDSRGIVETALHDLHMLMFDGLDAETRARQQRSRTGEGWDPPAAQEAADIEAAMRRLVAKLDLLAEAATQTPSLESTTRTLTRDAQREADLQTLATAERTLRDSYRRLLSELKRHHATDGLPPADTVFPVTKKDRRRPWRDPDHDLDPYLRTVLNRLLDDPDTDPRETAQDASVQIRNLSMTLGQALDRLRLVRQSTREPEAREEHLLTTVMTDAFLRRNTHLTAADPSTAASKNRDNR